MGFCSQCGTASEGKMFCPSCGNAMEQNVQGQYPQGQNVQGQYQGQNAQGPYQGQNAQGPYQGQNAQGPYQGQNAQGPYQGQNAQGQFGQGFQKLNNTDYTSDFDPQDINANKGITILSYIGLLFFIPLLVAPNSRFARFHASQGLTLCLGGVAVGIVSGVLSAVIRVPHYVGFYRIVAYYSTPWYINLLIVAMVLTVLAFAIIGIVNVIQGKAKELPLIGKIKLIK